MDLSKVKTIGSGLVRPEGVMTDDDGTIYAANICFGWEERKTAFLGSLGGTTIPYFEVPFPGMKLIHQKN
ncbi:MAG: hypothetical protein HY787_12500 [Deltaproteobacteria bacterium]|nr:hypothetical protein [Deltaproteobacteria bacterium]